MTNLGWIYAKLYYVVVGYRRDAIRAHLGPGAVTGKHISELQQTVFGITGRLYSVEDNLPATADMRIVVPQRVKAMVASGVAPYPVVKVTDYDGTKVYFEHDNRALLRFSGTEPVLRIFAEADTPEKARALVDWLKQHAQA